MILQEDQVYPSSLHRLCRIDVFVNCYHLYDIQKEISNLEGSLDRIEAIFEEP
jgi:hypothetical protein